MYNIVILDDHHHFHHYHHLDHTHMLCIFSLVNKKSQLTLLKKIARTHFLTFLLLLVCMELFNMYNPLLLFTHPNCLILWSRLGLGLVGWFSSNQKNTCTHPFHKAIEANNVVPSFRFPYTCKKWQKFLKRFFRSKFFSMHWTFL